MGTVRPPSSLPLLLLPGTLCDERVFAPLIARLPNQPVLLAEMTGAATTPDLAERILRRAPDRFALLGFSLGGIVALEMIHQAPHRIAALALVDTTARADPVANAAIRRGAVERARAHGMASYIDDAWPDHVSPVNAGRRDLRDLLVAMAERGGADALASQTEVAIHRADSRPRLPQIEVPTLVLCGQDDGICRPDLHREIADLIPTSTLAVVPDAGHFLLVERPDKVAAPVRSWLASVHPIVDERRYLERGHP
jgi:pimeloyl-ACP methyl ester carboxylesterase